MFDNPVPEGDDLWAFRNFLRADEKVRVSGRYHQVEWFDEAAVVERALHDGALTKRHHLTDDSSIDSQIEQVERGTVVRVDTAHPGELQPATPEPFCKVMYKRVVFKVFRRPEWVRTVFHQI